MSTADFDARRVAESIDSVLTGPHFITAVRPLLTDLAPDDPLRPRLFPMEYRLDDASGDFAPIWEGANGVIFPPYIESVDQGVVEDWAAIADALSDPAGKARYHDVLWVARHGNPGLHARLAIAAYGEAAEQDGWHSILQTEWLQRGLHLAGRISAPDLAAEIAEQMMQRGLASLQDDDPKPGVVLGFLEPLVGLDAADRPDELGAALERATELFAESAFLAEEILQLRARLVGIQTEDGRAFLIKAVDLIVADADRSDSGLRRRALLDGALQFATLHGLAEVQDRLVASIESITEEELGLHTVTAEVEVDREPIDRIGGHLAGGADWPEVILRIAALGPLVGEPTDRITEATAQMQQFPITALASSVVIGQYGETVFRPTTDEERLDWERVKLENLSLQLWGTIVADAIDQAHDRLGNPDPDEVAGAFEAVWCPPDIARKFARALEHYLAGAFDESVLVMLPRIEKVIRNLAREAGVAIIQNPHSNNRNGVRTLGELLFGGLQNVLDEHLHRHLVVELIKPTGLNLRNNHLHGLAGEGDRVSAALLMHTGALITHLQKTARSSGD